MSQENVELASGWFDRWNSGGRGFSDDEVDPRVQVLSRFQPEPFQGRDGLRRWMAEIDEHSRDWQIVVDDWRDAGSVVVALGRIHIRGHESGVELDEPVGALIELDSGRLLRMQLFGEPSEALEAAGLSE